MTGAVAATLVAMPIVTISNLSFNAPISGASDYELRTDGNIITDSDGGTDFDRGDWINNANFVNLFEVRLTVSSGDAPNAGDSVNSWLDFSTSRHWGFSGFLMAGSWLIEIRYKSGAVFDSATVSTFT